MNVSKAYRVFYSTDSEQTHMVVLAPYESRVEAAVANKDINYEIGNRRCRLITVTEVPVSNVLVSDLSVIELMRLMHENS